MNNLPKIIGALALIVTLISPIMFATENLSETAMKTSMLIAMIAWFVVAPKVMSAKVE